MRYHLPICKIHARYHESHLVLASVQLRLQLLPIKPRASILVQLEPFSGVDFAHLAMLHNLWELAAREEALATSDSTPPSTEVEDWLSSSNDDFSQLWLELPHPSACRPSLRFLLLGMGTQVDC